MYMEVPFNWIHFHDCWMEVPSYWIHFHDYCMEAPFNWIHFHDFCMKWLFGEYIYLSDCSRKWLLNELSFVAAGAEWMSPFTDVFSYCRNKFNDYSHKRTSLLKEFSWICFSDCIFFLFLCKVAFSRWIAMIVVSSSLFAGGLTWLL